MTQILTVFLFNRWTKLFFGFSVKIFFPVWWWWAEHACTFNVLNRRMLPICLDFLVLVTGDYFLEIMILAWHNRGSQIFYAQSLLFWTGTTYRRVGIQSLYDPFASLCGIQYLLCYISMSHIFQFRWVGYSLHPSAYNLCDSEVKDCMSYHFEHLNVLPWGRISTLAIICIIFAPIPSLSFRPLLY